MRARNVVLCRRQIGVHASADQTGNVVAELKHRDARKVHVVSEDSRHQGFENFRHQSRCPEAAEELYDGPQRPSWNLAILDNPPKVHLRALVCASMKPEEPKGLKETREGLNKALT